MPQPLISIVSPCFNSGVLLLELRDCLARQSFTDFEWIIVDDGSGDETLDILEQIRSESQIQVDVILGAHRGGNVCRNEGFDSSTGRYLKFIDADDLIEPHLLECQYELIKNSDDAIVISKTADLYPDQSLLIRWFDETILNGDTLESYLAAPFFMHGGCLIPRHMVEKINGWDESLLAGQDLDFFRRLLLLNSPNIVFDESSLFYYRQHELTARVSRSDGRRKMKYLHQQLALQKFRHLLEKQGVADQYAARLANNYVLWARSCAYDLPELSRELLAEADEICALRPDSGGRLYNISRQIFGFRFANRITRLGFVVRLRRVHVSFFGSKASLSSTTVLQRIQQIENETNPVT